MFGDRMNMNEGVGVKLGCGHNHPQQGGERYCKLCGMELWEILGVCDVSEDDEDEKT
jgi:hypothetical protein